MVLYEVTEANALYRGEFSKLQAYLAHFYRAETELALDCKIGDFLEWDLIHAQPAAAQYDFQLPGFSLLLFTVDVTKGQPCFADVPDLAQFTPTIDKGRKRPFGDFKTLHLTSFDAFFSIVHGKTPECP